MSKPNYEYNKRNIGSHRKKDAFQKIVDVLFWPSIVFGPCNLFLVVITWNTSSGEGRWVPFVATPVFFVIVILKIWLDKQKE